MNPDKELKRIIHDSLDSMPASKVSEFVILNHRALFDGWAYGAFGGFVNRIAANRRREEARANPAQGWLPLPEFEGFQHIPAEVQEDTLEQYRETIAALERKIKFYSNPRRSATAEKADRQQLKEMKRLEPLIAPFFVGDPAMTVGRAVELYLLSPKAATEQRRKAAKQARARKAKLRQSRRI